MDHSGEAHDDESAESQHEKTMLRKLKKVFKARRQGSTTKSPDIDVVNTPFLELMEKLRPVEVTLTETMKEQLRDRIVSMSTEERREYYDCGGAFLVSEQIPSWQDTGQTDNEGASNVLFEPDDLLNSKVALWHGDIAQLELDVYAFAAVAGTEDARVVPAWEWAAATGYFWPAKKYVYWLPEYKGGREAEQRYYGRQYKKVLDYMKDNGYRTLVDKIVFCALTDEWYERLKKMMHTVFPVSPTAVPKPSAPTLPAEILRMDKQSIRLYKKALSEGETPVHSIRVMVVGHYGVGKTTLTKRLLGEDVYLGARDSTDGIDVHVRRCRVSLADQKWTVLKKDENVDNVSRRLVQVLAKQSISDTAATITVETASTSADAESLHKVTVPKTVDDENANTAEVVPTNDTIPKTPVEADVTKQCVEGDTENDAIIKDLKDLISNISISKYKDNDHADVSILDFGGQSVFYNTHQMFLSPRAIYILVMDISKHIDDIVDDDICYFDIKGGVLYKINEFFKLWLNSIHACCPPDKVGVPRIILVATHAGKLDQERRKELEDKYFEAVRNTFDGSVAYMHVVDADFSIDNEIVDPNIAALQNKIYEVASQQDHWGERIPANWLTVERALGELRNKGLKIITRDRLQDVNNSMHVPIATEDSLNVFLRFQHDTTNILYFNEAGLRDIVVLDPQWLVDSLKSVITSKDFVIKKPAIYELWKELYATGILRQKLIEAVWKREETFWDHKDHLLQLMKKLNIIAQIHGQTPDDCYIVPCMLKEAPDDRIKVDPNSTSVMCITTEDGFLTAGIFQRLLAGCVSKWPISKQDKKDLIYCGCGCFEIDTFHRMTLYFHACTIQMWVTCHGEENPLDPDLCAKVREYILQTLQNINTCLGLSQYSNLKLSIKCPKQGLDELEDGMFQIEQLEKHNEIPCHAHNETHILQCSDMLRCWYGGNIRPDSQDHYRSVRSPHIRETIPNDKQLSNIASKIGKEYEQLGLELGLTQVKIDQIKLDNPRNVVSQTTKILLAWKESVGWQATFRVLDQAMRTVDIDTTTALAGIN